MLGEGEEVLKIQAKNKMQVRVGKDQGWEMGTTGYARHKDLCSWYRLTIKFDSPGNQRESREMGSSYCPNISNT